jgi:N-hydroxyarylamine O-acetyltransferase
VSATETSQVEPLDDAQVAAYLARIGMADRPDASPGSLRDLQVRHLHTVPFENLTIHLGDTVSLSTADLFDKIVGRRRGGFCYELNGFFASLLTSLGYEVRLLGGGVYGAHGLGPPFDHLALLVDGWLVDVGFGRHSAYPLRLEPGVEQSDPCGVFTVTMTSDGDIEVSRDGSPQYRLEARPRQLADFAPTCWWQQTAPGSHFRTAPICTLLTDTFGVLTIANRTLISTEGEFRHETVLDSDDELLAAYRDHFGVVLDRPPADRGTLKPR